MTAHVDKPDWGVLLSERGCRWAGENRDNITKKSTYMEGNESFHHFTSSAYFNIKKDVDQKAHRTMKVILALVLIWNVKHLKPL